MFERVLLNSSPPRKTLPLACALEAFLAGALVLTPLIHTRALNVREMMADVWILPSPPLGPAPRGQARPMPEKKATPVTARDILNAPPVIPPTIPIIDEGAVPPEPVGIGVPGGLDLGTPGGSRDGVIGSFLASLHTAPPPPPATKSTSAIRVIHLGGQVVAARAISQPKPEYPPLARMARIEGTVRLEAIIDTDGTIQNLKVVGGHPLLVKAALEAVARWRYQPTLLNGEPVEVMTEIEVHFKLAP